MTRRLRLAALVSVLLHAAVLAGSIGFLRRSDAPDAKPDKQAMVELLMVEQKGAGPPAPGSPPPASHDPPAQPATQAAAQPPATVAAAPKAAPTAVQAPPVAASETPPPPSPVAPPVPDVAPPPGDSSAAAPPRPTPAPEPPAPAPRRQSPQPAPAPAPPAAKAPMEMNIAGTDSPSNAIASGDDIIPASVDQRVRNRPPIYPQEAARRGQQGTVVLVIHVSAAGLSSGSDVLQSSGVAALDQAAQDAVAAWRFLPAVKDGAPVPFDMPMRFVFEFN